MFVGIYNIAQVDTLGNSRSPVVGVELMGELVGYILLLGEDGAVELSLVILHKWGLRFVGGNAFELQLGKDISA